MGGKRKSSGPEAAPPDESGKSKSEGGGIAAAIKPHAKFFDELVELVPAKFYVPKDRSDEWLRYKHSKSEKAAAKMARKENSKKAKRLKLDPEEALTTSEAIQKKAEESSDDDSDDDDDDDDDEVMEDSDDEEPAPPKKGAAKKGAEKGGKQHGGNAPANGRPPAKLTWNLSEGAGAASKEELAQRLRKRIEQARSARKAEERIEQAQAAKDWRKKATGKGANKKRGSDQAKPPPGSAKSAKLAVGDVKTQGGGEKCEPGANSFDMTRMDGAKGGKHKKQVSKADQLKKAEGVQAVMAEGGVKAERHQWSAALKRATGEKVLDDPKLLRKTLKREQKRKAKSAANWEKKLHNQKETRDAKQTKRTTNLKARKDGVKERRMEKRDKKLLRPGFEGRSEGFLNGAVKNISTAKPS